MSRKVMLLCATAVFITLHTPAANDRKGPWVRHVITENFVNFAASAADSCDAPHAVRQFGVKRCKGGGIGHAFRAHNEVDWWQCREGFAPQHLPEASAQTIARHRAELEAGNDEGDPRVARLIGAPRQLEVRCAPPTPFFPAGRELRAVRQSHAARKALAR